MRKQNPKAESAADLEAVRGLMEYVDGNATARDDLAKLLAGVLPVIRERYRKVDLDLPACPKDTLADMAEFYKLAERLRIQFRQLGPAGRRHLASHCKGPNVDGAHGWPGWPGVVEDESERDHQRRFDDHVAQFLAPFNGGFEPRQSALT